MWFGHPQKSGAGCPTFCSNSNGESVVDVVRVDGRGGPGERYYSAHIDPIFGENLLRLTHLAPMGRWRSKEKPASLLRFHKWTSKYNHKKQKIEIFSAHTI